MQLMRQGGSYRDLGEYHLTSERTDLRKTFPLTPGTNYTLRMRYVRYFKDIAYYGDYGYATTKMDGTAPSGQSNFTMLVALLLS